MRTCFNAKLGIVCEKRNCKQIFERHQTSATWGWTSTRSSLWGRSHRQSRHRRFRPPPKSARSARIRSWSRWVWITTLIPMTSLLRIDCISTTLPLSHTKQYLLLREGKYHCMADLLFRQTSTSVVNFTWAKKLNPNKKNRRSAVHWYFPLQSKLVFSGHNWPWMIWASFFPLIPGNLWSNHSKNLWHQQRPSQWDIRANLKIKFSFNCFVLILLNILRS